MKRKITITTGTRADYGFLRPIIRRMIASKKIQPYVIVTGTHLSKKHGMTINEIHRDDYTVYATIKMMPQNDSLYSMSKVLGEGIIRFSNIFKKLQPDINLVLGDRDEMLASSIAAYHMNIPNAHIHGGDKSGGLDEYTRHAITKISNIHFAATKKSFTRIIKMGENPKYVFLTGSPSIDDLGNGDISSKEELEAKYHISFGSETILLVQHPVTTQVYDVEKQISNTLNAIIKLKKPIIAIAPNSDAGGTKIFNYIKKYSQKYNFIRLYPSVPRRDYLGMLNNCAALVGNSSSGFIEASFFSVPVVNIGVRQQERERDSCVTDVKDVSSRSILLAIRKALSLPRIKKTSLIYGNGTAAIKIVEILEKIKVNQELIEKTISY